MSRQPNPREEHQGWVSVIDIERMISEIKEGMDFDRNKSSHGTSENFDLINHDSKISDFEDTLL